MKTTHSTTYLGLFLLALFFLQFFLELEWDWLLARQGNESYKRWSGLGVALLIVFQWVLTLSRVVKKLRKHSQKMALAHKWMGALSPLIFYIHSTGTGYGYLALLAYVFLANALMGYINLDVVRNDNELLFKGWMVLHVACSLIITLLMLFHIGVVFYYK